MAGEFKAEYVFLQNNLCILRHRKGAFLRISPNDKTVPDEHGGAGAFAQWNVELDGNENGKQVIKLKSAKSGGYLRIYDNGNKMDVAGGGGKWTRFIVHRTGPNRAKLESVECKGKFPAVQPKGPSIGTGGPWTEFYFFRKGAQIGAPRGNYNKNLECEIALFSHHGKFLRCDVDGKFFNDVEHCKAHEIITSIPNDNGTVSFRTAHGKYISAYKEPHQWKLMAADGVDAWERFEVVEQNGKYAFKTAHGKHIRAPVGGDQVAADVDHIKGHELWQVRVIDVKYSAKAKCKISLFGAHGRFVRADPQGTFKADVEHCKAHEMFESIPVGNGAHVYLKTAHGKYLSVEGDKTTLRGADGIDAWEKWEPRLDEESGKWSFHSYHGKVISAWPEQNGSQFKASGNGVEAWELFTITVYEVEEEEVEEPEPEPVEEEVEEEPEPEPEAEPEEEPEPEPEEPEPEPEEEVEPEAEPVEEPKEEEANDAEDEKADYIDPADQHPQPLPGARKSINPCEEWDDDTAAAQAEVLRKAMKGLGTNEKKIIGVTNGYSHEQRMMIKQAYNTEYDRDLIKDFEKELGGKFEKMCIGFWLDAGRFDAELINEAVDGIGFSTKLLNEVICTRTNDEIEAMKSAWWKGQPMIERVADETKKMFGSGNYCTLMTTLLSGKRAPNGPVNSDKAQLDAECLNRYLSQESESDAKAKFVEIFTTRSWVQIREISGIFQDVSKKYTLNGAIQDCFGDGDTSKALQVIDEFASQPYDYWAKKLKDAMKGMGTNDAELRRILVSRAEVDLRDIGIVFGQRYGDGKTLQKWLKDDLGGDYEKLCLAVCGLD